MSSPAKQGHRGAKLTRDKRGGAKLTRNEHGDICNGANDRSGDVLANANANDRGGDILTNANANDRGDTNGQDGATCDEKHADNLRQNPHSADNADKLDSRCENPRSADNANRTDSRYALRTKRLALSAILAALAMILSYIESLIPMPIPIPGIKLGLANLIIVIAIYRLGFKYAFIINCVRILTAGLLFTGLFGVIYSFAGGVLSILIMYALYKTKLFSIVGISMAGGVAHNLGQLITACLIMSNIRLMSYFAVLLFSGMISGILIGIAASLLQDKLPHLKL